MVRTAIIAMKNASWHHEPIIAKSIEVKSDDTWGYCSKTTWLSCVQEVIRESCEVIVEQNFRNPFVIIDALIKEKKPRITEIGNLEE